ncbi:hypothetical protein NXY31_20905 [Bacteroides salyersiae]|nr:hypothetical protein [Bacteroides salyersiae]
MITIGGKEITAAYVGKRALSAVYAGARLVWSQSAAVSDLDTGKATSRGTGRTHGTVAVKLINE